MEKKVKSLSPKEMLNNAYEYLFTEMFNRVNISFEEKKEDYKKNDEWYLLHTWSEEEQNDYIEWVTNELYKNKTLRKSITLSTIKTKKFCKNLAIEFVTNYGWKIKNKKNEKN